MRTNLACMVNLKLTQLNPNKLNLSKRRTGRRPGILSSISHVVAIPDHLRHNADACGHTTISILLTLVGSTLPSKFTLRLTWNPLKLAKTNTLKPLETPFLARLRLVGSQLKATTNYLRGACIHPRLLAQLSLFYLFSSDPLSPISGQVLFHLT